MPRVLIYGPGGTAAQPYFPPESVVTVASESMWRSLTTANFGDYDLIWVDGNACTGGATQFNALRDTQATWGPAVRGRTVITAFDEDFHAHLLGHGPSDLRGGHVVVRLHLPRLDHGARGVFVAHDLRFRTGLDRPPRRLPLTYDPPARSPDPRPERSGR